MNKYLLAGLLAIIICPTAQGAAEADDAEISRIRGFLTSLPSDAMAHVGDFVGLPQMKQDYLDKKLYQAVHRVHFAAFGSRYSPSAIRARKEVRNLLSQGANPESIIGVNYDTYARQSALELAIKYAKEDTPIELSRPFIPQVDPTVRVLMHPGMVKILSQIRKLKRA